MTNIREKYARSLEDFYAGNLLVMKGKSEDYSEVADPFSNFRFAASAAGVTIEQVFLVLKGIKLARLKQLLLNDRAPNNESITDTLGDDANYSAIFGTYLELKDSTDPSYAYAGEGLDEAEEDEDDDPIESLVGPPPTEEQIAELFENPSPTTRMLNFFGLSPLTEGK